MGMPDGPAGGIPMAPYRSRLNDALCVLADLAGYATRHGWSNADSSLFEIALETVGL